MGCCGKQTKAEVMRPTLPQSVESSLVFAQSAGMKAVDLTTATKRYAICQSCPHFKVTDTVCMRCGCLVFVKLGKAQERCPALKW
jgi:ribosomal protein L32